MSQNILQLTENTRRRFAQIVKNSRNLSGFLLGFVLPNPAVPFTRLEDKAKLLLQYLWGHTKLKLPSLAVRVATASLATLICGCAVSHKTLVNPADTPAKLLTASKDDLLGRYNQQAQSITSLNAGVSMKLTAGSAYSGVIEQYHEVNGFILAVKPANIRVIGQAPVVAKNIFDMVSNGEKFDIYIPSKNEFIEGPDNLTRQASKPIENLRPQHLVDALLWESVPAGVPVLFEEASDGGGHFYILTAIRAASSGDATNGSATGSSDWEISRKIWFDRTNLHIARVENFSSGGKVASDVHYSNWLAVGAPPNASQPFDIASSADPAMATLSYPHQIAISRPSDDYQLQIEIKKLTLDEAIPADRFVLAQPAGTQLIHPDENTPEAPKP
jgi:outer membrane lipoprotein-sorting protein